jgi:hypothetical protein
VIDRLFTRSHEFGPSGWLVLSARLLVQAACVCLAIAFSAWSLTTLTHLDTVAYDTAAQRLRVGQELFAPGSMDDAYIYRYTPWFAVVWMTLGSFGPLILLLASTAALIYVAWATRGDFPVNLLLVSVLLSSMSNGNIHPVLVGAIVWTRNRWTGAGWIGIAASIKAAPAIFALVYLGRAEWRRFALAAGIAVIAAIPLLAYDLSLYPTNAGEGVILWGTPLYWPVIIAGCWMTIVCARSRYAWLIAAATVILAMPRFWPYDLAWLLVALPRDDPAQQPGRWRVTPGCDGAAWPKSAIAPARSPQQNPEQS